MRKSLLLLFTCKEQRDPKSEERRAKEGKNKRTKERKSKRAKSDKAKSERANSQPWTGGNKSCAQPLTFCHLDGFKAKPKE